MLLVFVLLLAGGLVGQELPAGKLRKQAPAKRIEKWRRDLELKKHVVPSPRPLPESDVTALDFSGTYRFGSYNYPLRIEQSGDRVQFMSWGVDLQDIGGAFQTYGDGRVDGQRIRARWWCFDLSRNYSNTGGAELWFEDRAHNILRVRYYHDADRKIEEGYAVRLSETDRRRVDYRIRIPQRAKEWPDGLVLTGTLRGRGAEAIEHAVVMLRSEEGSAVRTDADGRFRITTTKQPAVLMLAAAAPGYLNAVEALLLHEVRAVHFVLEPVGAGDDPRYEFIDPTPDRELDLWRCGNCHRNSYEEWKGSRHALSARDPVVLALYEKDFLQALDDKKAEGDPGLCSACHAPQAALDEPQVRLDTVRGTAALGNHCDFCHKVHHVDDPDAAGVRGSLAVRRPAPDDDSVPGPIKRIYGTLADSDYRFMGPTYSPFHSTSMLCAGCHQYVTPGGVPALNTYAEWKQWAALRPKLETCQSCHMQAGASTENGKPARRIGINALRRPSDQIHTHSFQGREQAREALSLQLTARRDGLRLTVNTSVLCNGAGHRVPTGSGDKHLLLVIVATDKEGNPLRLDKGPRVPRHAGGRGDPIAIGRTEVELRLQEGNFARLPGREFAQVLADADGNTHVPFWRAVKVVEDTRLGPEGKVDTAHVFELTGEGPYRIQAQLIHRLRYKQHDIAARIKGAGVRPLDEVVAEAAADVE